jgi:phage recombination protein Bet
MNGHNPTATTPSLSEEDIALLKRTTLKGFTDDQADIFIRQCQSYRLDPFTRQIYATRRMSHGNVTLVTVTGIVGLAALAERTGQYDGCQTFWAGTDGVWRDEWLAEEYPAAAKCIVYHKGHAHPEVGIARWNSYVGRSYNQATKRWEVSDFWEKMPDLMLAKVAKALALRGAFPDHLSGLYATEELDQGAAPGDELDDETKIAENRKREAELLKAAAEANKVKIVESKPQKRPTPAEAAAPAFPEPPAPPKPMSAAPVPPVVPPAPQEEPDDLEMGEPAAQAQPGVSADSPAGPTAAPDQTWKYHVIEGLTNVKFHRRTVGDLSVTELQAIADQWLPKVHDVLARGEKLKESQKADADAFEAAIAYYKAEKPW